MTTHYPRELKQQALEILRDTGGDINQTRIKTGVPERTLYYWRRELWQNWQQQPSPPVLPIPPKPLPQFEDDLAAMDFLRQKIMSELLNLANNFQTDSNYMTPAQRIILLTQLTDRFIKLDEYVRSQEEQEVEILHQYEEQVELEHHIEKKTDLDQVDEEDDDGHPFEIDFDVVPKEDPEGMVWNDREWVPIS